jgi:hypothetical protein
MADSTPPTGGSQAPASPPKRGRDSLFWRKYQKYLGTYVLLGIAALLIAGLVWEGIESGKWLWYRIGIALFMIAIAIANFATLHRRE